MDAQHTLGTILGPDAARDAIHIALAPVIAGEILPSAEYCKLDADGKAIWSQRENAIGIVDPFLQSDVEIGQRFWMFLLPNTVTGMRHHWSHPAFDSLDTVLDRLEPLLGRLESKAWITNFAAEELRGEYTSDELMKIAAEYQATGKEGCVGFDDVWNIDDTVFAEFWKHYALVTGTPVVKIDRFFRCAC